VFNSKSNVYDAQSGSNRYLCALLLLGKVIEFTIEVPVQEVMVHEARFDALNATIRAKGRTSSGLIGHFLLFSHLAKLGYHTKSADSLINFNNFPLKSLYTLKVNKV